MSAKTVSASFETIALTAIKTLKKEGIMTTSLSKRIPETASSTTRSVVNRGNNLFIIQVTKRKTTKENEFRQGNYATGVAVSGTRENWDSKKENTTREGSKWEEPGDRNSFSKKCC